MAYSREEMETTCVYDYQENSWIVYSCVQKHITKLLRIAGEPYWSEKDGERLIAGNWKLVGTNVRFAKKASGNIGLLGRNSAQNRREEELDDAQ
jgi:hypothetical protein